MPFVIGIDGYFKTGKTTLANSLSKKHNAVILDMGILYRIVTSLLLKMNLSEDEIKEIVTTQTLEQIMNSLNIQYNYQQRCFTPLLSNLYDSNVSMVSSVIGATTKSSWYPTFANIVRDLNQTLNVILVGRNLLKVFPELPLHIFLTSTIEKTVELILSERPGLSFEQAHSMAVSRMEIEKQIYGNSFSSAVTTFFDVSDKNAQEVFLMVSKYLETQLHA